jgi:hypothetical protein
VMDDNLFDLIAQIAIKDGASPMKKHEGCWNRKIDDNWEIWVNGHREPKPGPPDVLVQPFNCYVEFNGWPAGSFSPVEGCLAAGSLANEETFAEALKKVIETAPPTAGAGEGK